MIYPEWLQNLARADLLRSVGLYVTPDRLFLVRVRKDLWRLKILAEESREIPASDERISRREALSEAIRTLLPHLTPSDPLYVCLSPHHTIAYRLLLPQAAQENLAQVLEYEIERLLPFRRDEVHYGFMPMGKKGDKVALFLFAIPRRTVDDIVEALAAHGIEPRGIETTATALSNYLLFCAPGLGKPALVLGGQTQAWEIIGLDFKTNGWRKPRAELLFDHWIPQADWMLGTGKEIVHGCLSDSPHLFGWGYVHDFLSSIDEEPYQFQDLLALGRERLGMTEGLGHSFFVPAFGTALRGLREATFMANLLPGAGEDTLGRTLTRLNAFLALLLFAGLVFWGASYPVKDEIRLRRLQRENQKLAPTVEALQREEGELQRLRKELSLLSGVRARRGESLQVLDELSRIVPTTAHLSQLRYRDGTVELQGNAESASNLVPILERSPLFKNVAFNAPSTRSRDNRETFSLKAEMERGLEGGPKP